MFQLWDEIIQVKTEHNINYGIPRVNRGVMKRFPKVNNPVLNM